MIPKMILFDNDWVEGLVWGFSPLMYIVSD